MYVIVVTSSMLDRTSLFCISDRPPYLGLAVICVVPLSKVPRLQSGISVVALVGHDLAGLA